MAHVGQERCPCLGHAQCMHLRRFQLIVGLAQPLVAGLELQGACGHDVFQLPQVFGQPIFGVAALLNLCLHVFKLLVGNVHQHADFIVLVAWRAIQACMPAVAQLADDAHQRLGQHHVEQAQQDAGQQQAADEAVEQGDLGTAQEATAKGIGVHVQAQHTEGLVGHVAEEQPIFKLTVGAKQEIADGAVSAFFARAVDIGQHHAIVVDQLGMNDGGGVQQAQGQFLGQFGVDVVGDA